jgi:hypothetical protein
MNSQLFLSVLAFFAIALGAGSSPVNESGQPLAKLGAQNAFSWSEGLTKYSTITNCVSTIQGNPYQENGVGTYVGFYADPNAGLPAPNTPYYVHVVVAGLGNSCSGMRAYIEVALPPNTTLAISQVNKVNYYYDNVALGANEAPQTLPPSTYNPGAYQVLSTDSTHAYTWPIPQGRILEVQIPVVSTTPLTNSTFQANVWVLDGNSSPWLRPQAGIFVFNTIPTIFYSAPSTTSITKISGHSVATVFTHGAAGTGYFDLGTTASYGLIHDPVTIAAGSASWQVWDDWGPPELTLGTLYHWRFTFTTNGQTYYGADQTFTTLSASVAVGNQTPRMANLSGTGASRTFDALGRLLPHTVSDLKSRAGSAGYMVRVENGKPLEKGMARIHGRLKEPPAGC